MIDDIKISKTDILDALRGLGELAHANGLYLTLCLLGDASMIIEHDARSTTRRVDAVILEPSERKKEVCELAAVIAEEKGWPDSWLNADAGQHIGLIRSRCLLVAPGIEIHAPVTAQMLALNLLAWKNNRDISNAIRLLKMMPGSREDIWRAIEQFLPADSAATPFQDFDTLER